jgi:hypothetical protein
MYNKVVVKFIYIINKLLNTVHTPRFLATDSYAWSIQYSFQLAGSGHHIPEIKKLMSYGGVVGTPALKMEAIRSSEKRVLIYQPTGRHDPDDSPNLQHQQNVF